MMMMLMTMTTIPMATFEEQRQAKIIIAVQSQKNLVGVAALLSEILFAKMQIVLQ